MPSGQFSGIVKFTPGGVRSTLNYSVLNIFTGLAFDSTGNLYVATNNGVGEIVKFTLSSGVLSAGSVFTTSGLNRPAGLAFDSTGNLYAANSGNNTIEKFTLSSGVLSNVGSVFASTGLSSPVGLAFDSVGNLYAANRGNNTIEKFSPTGTDLGVFTTSGLSSPQYLAFTDDAGVPLKLANQTVPEPASFTLLGLGALFLAVRRRTSSQAGKGPLAD